MSDKQFPARLTPFAKNLERTMAEGVDLNGCRTVIRETPDGQAMLRTRAGMPEFSITKKDAVRLVMPSCVRAPLIEQDYAERTYYAETTLFSTCGMFLIKVRYLKSIHFLDADGNKVVFVFSSPSADAIIPGGGFDVAFVEKAYATRVHHASVLEGPETYPAIPLNSGKVPHKFDGLVFERKPIKSMTFSVNGVLDVAYEFEAESAGGNASYLSLDKHACMARNMAEIPASRNYVEITDPIVSVTMKEAGVEKYGEMVFAGLGGLLQMVSSEFCLETQMGTPWALSDLGIFGHCLHGLLRSRDNADGLGLYELIRHDGSTAIIPSSLRMSPGLNGELGGGCILATPIPTRPETTRTGLDLDDDVKARRQWLNYALQSLSIPGSVSGYRQGFFTDVSVWKYYDPEGNVCDIEFSSTATHDFLVYHDWIEDVDRVSVGGTATASLVVTRAIYDGEAHESDYTMIQLPSAKCRYHDGGGRPTLNTRNARGSRAIFSGKYRSHSLTYFGDMKTPDCPADFWELTISGTINHSAENAGLSFTWRLMDEVVPTVNKTETQVCVPAKGITVSTDPQTTSGSNDFSVVSKSYQQAVVPLGCYFVGDELKWITSVSTVEDELTVIASFWPEEGNVSGGSMTSTDTRSSSLSLLYDGVVVASRSGYELKESSSADSGILAGYVMDWGSYSHSYSGQLIDHAFAAAGNYHLIRITPHVFCFLEHTETFHQFAGFYSLTESCDEVITITEPTFDSASGMNGYSADPTDYNIYASWNPATGQLHVDRVPCRWI